MQTSHLAWCFLYTSRIDGANHVRFHLDLHNLIMLWKEFDPCRRLLRLEWGGKLFSPWVLTIVSINYFVVVWPTPQRKHDLKMEFKFTMRDNHPLVNELWPILEEACELQIRKFKILHVCIPISCTIMIPGPHPPCHSKTKQNKTICWLATPIWKIHFCNLWTFSRFFFGIESFLFPPHYYEIGFYRQLVD